MTFDNILVEGKDCHGLENQFSKEVNLHEQKKRPSPPYRQKMGAYIQDLDNQAKTTILPPGK